LPKLSMRELLTVRGTRIAGGKSGLPHLTVGEGGGSAGSGALGGGARGIGRRISRRRRLGGWAMPLTLPLLSLPKRLLFSNASFMPTLAAR